MTLASTLPETDGTRPDPWSVTPRTDPGRSAPRAVRCLAAASVATPGVAWEVWRSTGSPWLVAAAVAIGGAVAILGAPAAEAAGRRRIGFALGLLVALVGSRTGVGLGSALLIWSGASIAQHAFGGPRRTSVSSDSTVRREVFALLLAAQLACAVGAARAAWLPTALAAVIELLGVVRPRTLDRTRVATRRAAEAVAVAVAVPATLVAATILLYLPGLARRLTRVLTQPSAASPSWSPRVAEEGTARAVATRPFAATAPVVRRRRNIRGAIATVLAATVMVVTIGHAGGGVAVPTVGMIDRGAAPPSGSSRLPAGQKDLLGVEFGAKYSTLPAYSGVAWADELQREQSSERTTRSRYFNVVDGNRVTLAPPRCTCPYVSAWFVGGSAAFGVGQRDRHTIASDLVRLAGAQGIALDLVNISRDGSTMVEDAQRVQALVADGGAPDVVIYFNGWNDVLMSVLRSFAEATGDGGRDVADFAGYLQDVNARVDEFLTSSVGRRAGLEAARTYRSWEAVAEASGRRDGATSLFYFQPDALASELQLAGYESVTHVSAREVMASPLGVAASTAAGALDGRVVDLRHLFDSYPSPTFLGLVHQNETGAAIVAQRIFRDLLPVLRSRVSSR